jgi:rubrerythrin
MTNLAGTKTEANLKAAFAGESQARVNYVHFAAKAKEEGHDSVAHYLEETAANEGEHAKIWLRFLGGVDPNKDGQKTPVVGSSKDNLQKAIDGETFENSEMYPGFAKAARDEGFDSIAKLFDQVSSIEKTHADHFKMLRDRISSPAASAAVALPDTWKCTKCGNIVIEKTAPSSCNVCPNADGAGGKAFKQLSY